MTSVLKHPSSFRDPSGYIFVEDDTVLRRVNAVYFPQLTKLNDSGLYETLRERELLIAHEVIDSNDQRQILRPEQLLLTTFPHEWSFSQLKDAALTTLATHLAALDHGMVLKDASAFNVQHHNGKPVFIDTLSFDFYEDGEPWVAYGQFCRHFLAPLLLMKYVSPDFNRLQIAFLDGVPLEAASAMLPARTHLSPFIKANVHLHAKTLSKHKDTFETAKTARLSLGAQRNIALNMRNFLGELKLGAQTEWGEYYAVSNYDDQAFKFKEDTVRQWVDELRPRKVWDIGSNNGHFSRIIQPSCELVVSTDIDPVAVDVNYKTVRDNNETKIWPLLLDYTNPSPGIGFDNRERESFATRMNTLGIDCIMALALIHHLCIGANCSFEMLAESFSRIADTLLIEFVDPEDSWALKLLQSKRKARGLFDFYNQQNFRAAFGARYDVVAETAIPGSERTLYLMRKKNTSA